MREAPFVMTRKFTVSSIMKTIMPITKSPPITKCANPAITLPAALGPSAPWVSMSRVVATLSASRKSVAINRTVGNAENSSGLLIQSDTIRMSTDTAIDTASPKSISMGGRGKNRIVKITTTPIAKPTSCRMMAGSSPASADFAIGIGPTSDLI